MRTPTARLSVFAIPADQAPAVLRSGPRGQIAALLAEHFSRSAERVVINVAARRPHVADRLVIRQNPWPDVPSEELHPSHIPRRSARAALDADMAVR